MYDVLFHVICLLESSLGQGNYNWCPGTHSSLCLRTSLTDKQVLVGDLPCECLFHEGCNENTHKHISVPQTLQVGPFSVDVSAEEWKGTAFNLSTQQENLKCGATAPRKPFPASVGTQARSLLSG